MDIIYPIELNFYWRVKMEKFEIVDQITCFTEKIKNRILESLENSGFAVTVTTGSETKYMIQVLQKIQ